MESTEITGIATVDELIKSLRPNTVRYCQLYASGMSQVKAAVLAGYVGGYGDALWKDPRVRALTGYYKEFYAEQAGLTQERLVQLWARQAGFSPAVLLHDDWSLKRLDELTEAERTELRDALVGVDVVEKHGIRTVRPRFNRQNAQEQLGKLMGLYGDARNQPGEGLTLTINVGQSPGGDGAEQDVREVGHLRVRLPAPASDQGGQG